MSLLDRQVLADAIEGLADLKENWNGYKAEPISLLAIRLAHGFAAGMPDHIVGNPKVVPMTRGRLQFEWHRGNRSLEIEFGDGDELIYLKWDSVVAEEGSFHWLDRKTTTRLLKWFAESS